MVLQLLPVGGPFAVKLAKTVRAFAEARDLQVLFSPSLDEHKVHALAAAATIIILDDAAAQPEIQFVSGATYALFGINQAEMIESLHLNAIKNQAIQLLPPLNAIGGPESFEYWTTALWDALAAKGVKFQFPRSYKVDKSGCEGTSPIDISVPQGYRRIPVEENTLLTSEDYPRPSHMLTLNISHTGFKYNLGDHVTILPRNSPEAVENAGQGLGLDLDEVVVLQQIPNKTTSLPIPVGVPIRVRDILTYYLDIQGLARRRFLAALSLIATAPDERNALHELATRMNSNSPYRHKLRNVFTNIDAIKQHPSVSLSLEDVLSLLPPLSPRCYSASSSPLKDSNTVQCTFVVLEYPTQDKTIFRGLSTNFLRALKPGDSVAMTIRKGFKEVVVDKPCIKYVGCALGSGIALLRGIAQHFHYSKQYHDADQDGKMLLYYGVRHEAKDFIFKNELLEYQKSGVLDMHASFSHDQEAFLTPATKIGESQEDLVKFLVDDSQCIFIYCGPAGPAYESVEQAIKDAIKSRRPSVNIEEHLKKMRAEARWEVQAFSPAQDPENPFRF